MNGIIKMDYAWVVDEDDDKVLEVHMWLMEKGSDKWADLGTSHYLTKERLLENLRTIRSRGWEVLVPYEIVYIG